MFRFLVLGACFALMSCAGGNDQFDEGTSRTGGKADGVRQDPSIALADGYHFTISSSLTISEEDDTDPAKTYVVGMAGVVFVENSADGTTFQLKPCVVRLPEVSDRQPEIEPSTVQNLAPVVVQTEFEEREDGLFVRTSNGVLLAGVDLSDPANEPLPDSRRDDRLTDVDGDGKPGMSLLVDGFKLYTAMRIKMSLEGKIEEQGIAGQGTMSIEIGTYGDNVPFVDAAKSAEEAIGKLTVDNQEHLFTFSPVGLEELGCEGVEFVPLQHTPLPEVEEVDEDAFVEE